MSEIMQYFTFFGPKVAVQFDPQAGYICALIFWGFFTSCSKEIPRPQNKQIARRCCSVFFVREKKKQLCVVFGKKEIPHRRKEASCKKLEIKRFAQVLLNFFASA